MKPLKARLIETRKRLGLSQEGVARQVDVATISIQNIERGMQSQKKGLVVGRVEEWLKKNEERAK